MLDVCLECERWFDLADETCGACEKRAEALVRAAAEKAAEATAIAQWGSRFNGVPLTLNASDNYGMVTYRFNGKLLRGNTYGAMDRDGTRYLRVLCGELGQWHLVECHNLRSWEW